MSKKMDRQGVRRPADLERKYKFQKRFEETQKTAEEAKRIASEVSHTDSGLSLKVEALDNELNGADGVMAQLALKVETDADGKLKSKVRVTGDEFTVDTENFKLDENGSVEITGAFTTKSPSGQSTSIRGGEIISDVPYVAYRSGTYKYRIFTFYTDAGQYGVYVCGILEDVGGELFFRFSGIECLKVGEE